MTQNGLARRVEAFIDRLDREDVCMHGFLLSVGGRDKAAAYYAPFYEGQPHRMYSVSKSLTCIALGLLMDEGKVRLGDKIVDFFPDLLPKSPDPRLMRLTIADMLRMATCYRQTVYREGVDESWTKPFFTAEATHEPGTAFHYDTGCSQALASLVRRLSGREVIDFLNERFFGKIGANDEKFWLRDPSGACQGGTGLCMSLRDLHRTAQCILRGGEGVVPAWFCREMTKRHIGTPLQANEEERYGYGWQCWRTRSGWAMYGMGGQLAIACPEKDALISTVADTRLDPFGVQRIYNAFYEEVYPFLGVEDMPFTRYERKVRALPHDPAYARTREGVYRFAPNMLKIISLSVKANELIIENDRGRNALRFGLGENVEGVFPGWDIPSLASGGWGEDGALHVRCYLIGDAPCGVDLLLNFGDHCVTVQSRRSISPATVPYEGVATGYIG